VVRDGEEQVIWTHEVVVGDIVSLTQGDEVPADGLFLVRGDPLTKDGWALSNRVG
jgi:magnesium-transporting ATPase (P-type)